MTHADDLTSMGAVTHMTQVAQVAAPTAPTATAPGLDEAVQVADAAARAAGVTVREVGDLGELGDVVDLLATIWGRGVNPPVTLELLRAFTKAGNYVGGAFEGDRLVGACVGFFHSPAEDALHSHIAGVSSTALGRSVGFAIKLHQRSWVMLRGVSDVAWTFDPLVRRNAHFNLVKLGTVPVEYLPNFYGAMPDRINGGDDTDRLLVRWPLRDPAVLAACAGAGSRPVVGPDAVVALDVGTDGLPVLGRLDAATSLVQVPHDVETLRRTDPAAAQQWRTAVREVLTTLVADGARIVGLDATHGYVLHRTEPEGDLA
ncbi:GNAT family N-acetyltransferase [Nocardioides plantarum]|uniref:GNAT family N-acetyltransferase n=1 Tax=Nocardioides plantarum TaxID=29299 RepID=A0ABV5KAS5_9ACTN|nr:GNAT family N-acetyltransferase [Nocardioides plantarum]